MRSAKESHYRARMGAEEKLRKAENEVAGLKAKLSKVRSRRWR